MTYTYTTDFGGGIILAPCLQVLCAEIAQRYPAAVNLGEIGDASHQAEGYSSDHNPFITHNGKRYVRAIDIGGPADVQQALFNFFQVRYCAHDQRVWPYGYVHKDNVITEWFTDRIKADAGDVGHLHISVTQANGAHPSPAGWVAGLDSRAPWGLLYTGKDWLDMDAKDVQQAVATTPIKNPDSGTTMSLAARILDIETTMGSLAALVRDLRDHVAALDNPPK